MRAKELIQEVHIHGSLTIADQVAAVFSNSGDTVILFPKKQNHYGQLMYKFNPEGLAYMEQLMADVPKEPDYKGSSKMRMSEKGFKESVVQNATTIMSFLEPKHGSDVIGQELSDYYADMFKKTDLDNMALNMYPTAQYGRATPKFKDFELHVGTTGLGSLLIDNTAKTIGPEFLGKGYHDRMGTYSGKNTTYVLIDSSFTFNNDRKLVKALRGLVSKFPELAEYNFSDGRSGQQKQTKVRDLLAGPGIRAQDQALNQMLTRTTGKIFAFHGTSLSTWKKIQNTGFMAPGFGPDYSDKLKGHSEHLMYFSLNRETVRRYAVRAAMSRTSVILQVEINDMTKIRFDEDSMLGALMHVSEKVWKPFVARLLKAVGASDKYDAIMAHSRHNQIYNYLGYYLKWDENVIAKLTAQDPSVLSFINAMALKVHGESGFSFGYKGKIPANKIKMIESFESQKFSDEKDYNSYDAKYDEVKATQQFHD